MGEDDILYDASTFIYFSREANKEQNFDYIKTLDSYRKRRVWKLIVIIPSLFFTLFFGSSFLHFSFVPELGVDKPFVLGFVGVITLLFIYVLFMDIKSFWAVFYPKDDPSFLYGRVVGKLVRKEKKKGNQAILLEVDAETKPQVLAVNVSKRIFDDAEVDDEYWIYSEKYNLYAIKNK